MLLPAFNFACFCSSQSSYGRPCHGQRLMSKSLLTHLLTHMVPQVMAKDAGVENELRAFVLSDDDSS